MLVNIGLALDKNIGTPPTPLNPFYLPQRHHNSPAAPGHHHTPHFPPVPSIHAPPRTTGPRSETGATANSNKIFSTLILKQSRPPQHQPATNTRRPQPVPHNRRKDAEKSRKLRKCSSSPQFRLLFSASFSSPDKTHTLTGHISTFSSRKKVRTAKNYAEKKLRQNGP